MANEKVYIHEFIDIIGHNRARYMHHMTANWSPSAQTERAQRCFGVWAALGSTGRWPVVVNLWEHDGWDGLAASFATETVGPGAQDARLEKWWAAAADFRSGGVDRILVPAPWTRTIDELCDAGVRGACYAHELIRVAPAMARGFLERVRETLAPLAARTGWDLVGGWTTAMGNDDECVLLWSIPTWDQWAAFEAEHRPSTEVSMWRVGVREIVLAWERILLIDAPLSPMRIGRQPSFADRTDWTD